MKINSLNRLVYVIIRLLLSNRDCVIVISGERGEGKSTLSIQIARILYRQLGKKFFMKQIVKFVRKDLQQAINCASPHDAIIADEAIMMAFSRDFAKKEQKDFVKFLDHYIDRDKLIILNLPHFWSLDSHILNSRVRYWIYVEERGKAIIFKRHKHPYTKDPWNVRINTKIMKLKKGQDKLMKRQLRHSHNYVGRITFKQMPEKIEERYLTLKRKVLSVGEPSPKELSEKQKQLEIFDKEIWTLKNIYQLKPSEIAEIKGKKREYISQRLTLLKKNGSEKALQELTVKTYSS